jgi:hypothetical protein
VSGEELQLIDAAVLMNAPCCTRMGGGYVNQVQRTVLQSGKHNCRGGWGSGNENTCQVKGCNCQGLNRYVEYAMLYKAAGRGRDNQAQHTVGLTCREGGGGQRQRGHMPI